VIATDRPSVTDSSAVFPYRVFRENGWLDTGNQGSRTLDFPETLMGLGIGPSTELRFTTPDYYQNSPTSGFGYDSPFQMPWSHPISGNWTAAAYKITPGQQLDPHAGAGLSAAAVHHFVGIGYSFAFLSADDAQGKETPDCMR
jgi:hypothetical protein